MPSILDYQKRNLPLSRQRGLSTVPAVFATLLLASGPTMAVDVDAGDYTALPAGTNLAMGYYQFATRDALYSDGNKAPINAGLDSHIGILRGVHFTEIAGYIVDPQFLLPVGKLEGKDDTSGLGDASGIGDLTLAATVWLVNEPESNTYFGITPFVFAPTGSYDKKDALNLGENRWKYALQAGFITGLTPNISLDLAGDVTFYGENDEFGASNATLKQDPSYQLQGYLRYHMSSQWDLRAGVSHTLGGETKVNGIDQDNRMSYTKMTLGTAWFATPSLQLLANYGTDLSIRNGFKEQHRINLRILKAF
ncbi:transporter [Marinobacter sp. 1-4A]|uniref:transporter n=1 Tax=Marinobacter sp. 1-4A TaxID=2582919 RepID=UPI001906ECC7|nr:transporter [Marinobacter sp. 1-4A]MBK1850085.1 transporter [Marinobacter sp. 1-4A]